MDEHYPIDTSFIIVLCSTRPDLLEGCEEERRSFRQHDADATVARDVLRAQCGGVPRARRTHRHRQLQGLQEHPRSRAEIRRRSPVQVSTLCLR